ncbi:hypothetical protein [Methyloterricola oryzae]|uniref:hypothetical protein n=1 Tax=Methyloterricola oryzae TaxID=1495050 RepID=UPI0005EB29C3|nr:hypothetical protein [Methyloterricola oryzae]
MNRGSDEAELLAAFSQIVLKQFREMLKDTAQHGEEDMFALAETSEDLFFRTHVCDVLNELRQETLAIQLSFATDLRRRFQSALSGEPAGPASDSGADALPPELVACGSMQSCQDRWLPEAEKLGVLALQRLTGSVAGAGLRLPLTPMDVASAYFRALDSIRLPVHTQIKACLAELLAKRLDGSLGDVYSRFADYLESGDHVEWVEDDEPLLERATSASEASAPLRDSGHVAGTSPEPEAEAPGPISYTPKISGPPRMGPLEALVARETGTLPAEPAPASEPNEPAVAEAAPVTQAEAVPLNKGLAFAAAACLLVVALLLGRHYGTPHKDSPARGQVLSAQPAATASPPADAAPDAATMDLKAASPAGADIEPSVSAPVSTAPPVTVALDSTDLDDPATPAPKPASTPSAEPEATPAPKPTAKPTTSPKGVVTTPEPKPQRPKKADEAARSKPSPSPSATPLPRAASAAVMRKLKLRGYDWVRGRDDGSTFMKLSLFNGSSSPIQRIKLTCTAYSDSLARLQSVGKSVTASIEPGATGTVRHINLGRLHKKTARISCAVENVEIR